MKALEHFEVRPTGNRVLDGFYKRNFCDVSINNHLPESTAIGIGLKDEFRLEVRLGIIFHASPRDYAKALEVAKKSVLHALYRPILLDLQDIERAVSDGDAEAALEIVAQMRGKLGL